MLDSHWTQLLDPKDPLVSWRKKGWDLFQLLGLPKPKQEAFQYLRDLPVFPPLAIKPAESEMREGIVFSDGFFMGASVEKPIVVSSLPKTMLSFGVFLQNRMTRLLKEERDPFAALNIALQGEGAFLYVPPKCKAALHLTQLFTQEGLASSYLHVYVGRGAELKLMQGSVGTPSFSNVLLDFALDEGAQMTFVDQAEGQFQTVRASLKRDSKLKAVFVGKNVRTSMHVQLTEENCEAELVGLARLQEGESHVHTLVEHMAPHGRSRQHFKNVVAGDARFSFEGKIKVHPIAQKTESYQLCNSLILSEEAASFAKPNLEIFADDVKASHGATTGQLDEEAMFYLRSRGLDRQEAKRCLIEGFCKEILNQSY